MRLLKKTLSIVTVLSLAFSVPVTAEEGGEISDGNTRIDITKFTEFYEMADESLFTVDEKGVITAVDASLMEKEEIVIPDYVKNEKGEDVAITGLGEGSFKNLEKLKKIFLPDTIDTFGKECFKDDNNLEAMMPYYEEQVFTRRDFEDALEGKEKEPTSDLGALGIEDDGTISFPEIPVDEIAKFYEAKLVGFEYNGEEEDYPYHNLPGFFLPKSLVNVDGSAFIGCEKITRFDYNMIGEEETGLLIAGCKKTPATGETPEIVEATNELLLTKDGKKLICMAPGFKGDNYNFAESGADTIEEIGAYACYNNPTINGFIIPATVKTIGDYAFYGCVNQHQYTFAEGSVLETVGAYAYANTVNLNIVLPATVKTIGAHVFDAANNAVIDISKTQIENIPEYAFANQPTLHELTTPVTLKTIAPYAFANSENLDTVNFLGETLDSIGKGAFEGCRTLHVINIPEGVKAIEEDTFNGCGNLGIVILPESLEEIGANAFKDCVTIHEMVIPAGVKYVDKTSFSGAKIDNIDTSKNALLAKMFGRDVKPVETDEQKAAKLMGKVLTIKGYKYKVTKTNKTGGEVSLVGMANKKKAKKLKKLTVKNTVSYKFEGKKYTYKVTSIGKKAFKNSKKLKKVTIGANVTSIGKGAFYNCKKLSKVVVKSKSLKSVGKKAFRRNGGKKLTISVPKKLKKKYKKLFKRAKTNKYVVK